MYASNIKTFYRKLRKARLCQGDIVKDLELIIGMSSQLASFMGEIDGYGINYYVKECSEDSDYWLVAQITIKNKGRIYQLTYDSDYGFDMDSPEKLIEGIARSEELAQKTIKDFEEVDK